MTIHAPEPLAAERPRIAKRRRLGPSRPGVGSVPVLVAEGLTAVGVALLTTWLARFVDLDPMSRIGQVSGLAALQLQLIVLLAVVVLIAVHAMPRWPVLPLRFASAAVAGLASGVTAAGVSLALRDTVWPLYGQYGDSGVLQAWSGAVMNGRELPGVYPPLFPHLVAGATELFTNGDVGHALKIVDLLFIALLGPLAYLAWRLLLPPLWSLGIGVTAALPMMQPYKPYTSFVLVAFVPVMGKLLQLVQRARELAGKRVAFRGAGLGLMVGVLFELYSGWFVWSALGMTVLVAYLLVRLFRTGGGVPAVLTALVGLSSALAAFLVVAGPYLVRLLSAAGSTVDRYCYFDTYTEPTYFAMWRDDLPGSDALSTWPLPGELGGVSLFSVLLLVGLGLALALGSGQPAVLAAVACSVSALVMRYWYASHMEKDQAVMLYPRTSAQLLYCMLVLAGLACYLTARRFSAQRRKLSAGEQSPGSQLLSGSSMPGQLTKGAFCDARSRKLSAGEPSLGSQLLSGSSVPRQFTLGALCALGLLYGMAGSATASKYMPVPDGGSGALAWQSQTLQSVNGHCSKYAPNHRCGQPSDLSSRLVSYGDNGKLSCPTINPFLVRPR